MSTSVVANRIYLRSPERYVAEDFQEVAPDTLLLRGCKPPTKTEGGLILPGAGAADASLTDHPVRACVAFEVVKLPAEMSRGNPLSLAVGDVIACRNVLVDPLLGNELAIADLYLGPIGVLERAKRGEA